MASSQGQEEEPTSASCPWHAWAGMVHVHTHNNEACMAGVAHVCTHTFTNEWAGVALTHTHREIIIVGMIGWGGTCK